MPCVAQEFGDDMSRSRSMLSWGKAGLGQGRARTGQGREGQGQGQGRDWGHASIAADCVGSYCFLMKSRKGGVLASEGHMRRMASWFVPISANS